MIFLTILIFLAPSLGFEDPSSAGSQDHWKYHEQINKAEIRISNKEFDKALDLYEEVFNAYDHIFLKDHEIAAQLAFYTGDQEKALEYIKAGIVTGWDLKSIKKHKYLSPLQDHPKWENIEAAYLVLHNDYLKRIDRSTRELVHEMFKKDQRKALGALFRIGDKAQENYALRKFAPHSESQIGNLIKILKDQGYPGEQLVGNNYWMSTIISHHNSITQKYIQADTLFTFIRPELIKAIGKGQMSPYEFALIEDWRITVASDGKDTGYGFLNPPKGSTLIQTDKMRQKIGLRTVELRNRLIDIEEETGMQFYLPD